MAMIRQADVAVRGRGAVVLDLGDLGRQAEILKARARAEAERIIAEAKAERERLIAGASEQGRREGFAKGTAEGREAGRKEGSDAALAEHRPALEALEKGWGDALRLFESERDRMVLEGKRDVVALAAAVAERVTKRVVALDPAVVEGQLEALLELVLRPTRLKVGVHPQDMDRAKGALAGLCERIEAAKHVDLVPDETAGRGSCVARTGTGGMIDASVGSQLDSIVATLLPGAEWGAGGGASTPPAPGGPAPAGDRPVPPEGAP